MSFSYDVCNQFPGPLEPYGDIAGLGVSLIPPKQNGKDTFHTAFTTQVVLAFVISVWLTILILVAYYIFAFDPDVNPFHGMRSTAPHSPNPLDVLVTKYTSYLRVLKGFTGSLAENSFHKVSIYSRYNPMSAPLTQRSVFFHSRMPS